MKFRCRNCTTSFISKETFPDKCPHCGSTDFHREITESDVNDELEKIRQKKSERLFQGRKNGGADGKKVRIVVPVVDESGLNAHLSGHFGRAPYFAVVDLDESGRILNQRTIANVSEHFGGVGRPPDRILQLKLDALITYGMGGRAINIFQNASVAVLRTDATTLRDVIAAYNNDELEELTEGCHQARH